MSGHTPPQALAQLTQQLTEQKAALLDGSDGLESRVRVIRVRSYLVSAHAALEECAESLGLWLLEEIIGSWQTGRHCLGHTSLALLRLQRPKADIELKISSFDLVRQSLDDSAEKLRKAIKYENHGVSEKYLRKIFVPLGVPIPGGDGLIDINDLANRRGHNAHNGSRGVIRDPNPSDAESLVKNCKSYMEILADAVQQAAPR